MLGAMPTSTPDNAKPRGWLELAHFRKRDGWSRAKLAEAAGLSDETLRLYENGQRNPTPPTIRALANALRVPYSVLMPSPRDGDDEEGAA
jgi:transcriptional regulator with XRE-family HTH domain